MKKLTKKLMLSILTVALTFIALGTSTFAWFSMNSEVTVTGMDVKTRVSDNLQVAAANVEEDFRNGLNQTRTGVLEPVSTVDAVTYSWHATNSNVNGNGSVSDTTFTAYNEDTALENTAAGKTNYDDAFVAGYGVSTTVTTANVLYGYIDYSFYLKAINSSSATQKLAMTVCNLLYKGQALSSDDRAWRVAVFAVKTDEATEVADSTLAVAGNRKTILGPASAVYFDGKAVNGSQVLDTNPSLGTAAMIDAAVPGLETSYYKVIVRLWLEGQDNTCSNSTYAALTSDYTLDLRFVLGENPTGASQIGSVASAVVTKATTTGTVTLSDTTTGTIANGETAVSFQWYTASDNAAIDGATTYQYTNTANTAKEVYCLVTTARGSIYRTNTVELDPAA